jgi:hypothetical protein
MYSLSFLIVELETARTTFLDVFEVSNGPRLAKELAEVIKTGKEEDRFYGLSSKISG